jgi:tryptophan halogenase
MISPRPLRTLVIVGGGTAGWMTAALLSRAIGALYSIKLVESEAIGTVGVGEATIPSLKIFNALAQVDETEMLRRTMASYKLGIEFVDWREKGHSYIHGFGKIGADLMWLHTHHLWLALGGEARLGPLDDYSLNARMCRLNRFSPPQPRGEHVLLADIDYAYHFDAGLYARYLRELSEQRGVERIEGRIDRVEQDPQTGHVSCLHLQSGARVAGDLFIDCSGLHALLIDKTMGVGFDDWSHWLPCDRAWALPGRSEGDLSPYTRSTARDAGWQWRIPLQHRTGNGYVFSSRFLDEQAAGDALRADIGAAALAEPKLIRFRTGKRQRAWEKNVVAIGLSCGFLEPLESTSIHLIQTGALKLLALFPSDGIRQTLIDEYNAQIDFDYVTVRDFLIAHYKVTRRNDTPFWAYCKGMDIPDSLKHRLELFKDSARWFRRGGDELFFEESWVQVLIGQGIDPGYDHHVDLISPGDLEAHMQDVRQTIDALSRTMPEHADYIRMRLNG